MSTGTISQESRLPLFCFDFYLGAVEEGIPKCFAWMKKILQWSNDT